MYFHRVQTREFFVDASRRKPTRKVFWDAPKLMVLIYHNFVANPIYPYCTFLSYPFHLGIWFL